MSAPSPSPLLEVRDLRTYFDTDAGTARAVDGVSFSIAAGECLALVGESGCGKSVTSLTIMRLLPEPPARVASGQVLFEGQNLLDLDSAAMCQARGAKVSMIFQEPQTALNPVFTIGDQVAEAYWVHHPEAPQREGWMRALEALKAVGIPDAEQRMEDYPHQLSGGMKQRVCIAMALICEPRLIIADEPTTALDVTIQAQILELLRRLQQERAVALLLITHDLGIVAEMAARVCVMYAGKIVETASTRDLFAKPLHPYTQGLLRARPEAGSSRRGRKTLAVIPGMVPAATLFGNDCRFRPRCPLATGKCLAEPSLVEYLPGHCAACWHTSAQGLSAWEAAAPAPPAPQAPPAPLPQGERGGV